MSGIHRIGVTYTCRSIMYLVDGILVTGQHKCISTYSSDSRSAIFLTDMILSQSWLIQYSTLTGHVTAVCHRC